MDSKIIKLKEIELENFKNVKYGKISFKEDKKNQKISNTLGIYGQNGSGKTAIINAIYILKKVVSGEKLNPSFCNFISCDSSNSSFTFEFKIQDKRGIYKVFYKFEIRKTYKKGAFYEDLFKEINENLEIENPMKFDIEDDKDITVEIFREKLTYSKYEDNQWKKNITIVDYDMDDEEYIFRPIKTYKEIANSRDKKVQFGIARGISIENSTSFIFNPKTFSILISSLSKSNSENAKIIALLRNFVTFNTFVIQSDELGQITSNITIPFSFILEDKKNSSRGSIGLKLFDVSIIDEDKLQLVQKILRQVNVVLNTIIPNLQIEIRNYGTQILTTAKEGFKVELLSVRNGIKIPLKYESDGIKKVISILSVLIGMYNNESILVAIDELDAGIFEYLLGEILEIISKSAKGQLIFTSHNLRALEKLDKDLVIFTTTNENNRYINLNNSKVGNNLRDFYYRGIMLGGQKENLYNETNKYEINYAFRKAWMIGSAEHQND